MLHIDLEKDISNKITLAFFKPSKAPSQVEGVVNWEPILTELRSITTEQEAKAFIRVIVQSVLKDKIRLIESKMTSSLASFHASIQAALQASVATAYADITAELEEMEHALR